VPLTLVTGPANSAKAGEVLGGLRARLEDDPILVVPAFQDVEHSQRELADRGAIFGARVLRFKWLFETIAERVGYGEPVASELQRELILEEAMRDAPFTVLAESALQPGFGRAALRFVAELERSMVEPGRFTKALRQWAGDGLRRGYAEDVAAVYARYRDGLEKAGMADPELFAWRALDALRREPRGWERTPVFVYGFDNFTPLELDALETLAEHCQADVTVSLPFEPGRLAFRAVAETYGWLRSRAAEHRFLEPVSDHYADASREPLHHLERGLFEAEPGDRVPAGDAVELHSAGGERAEVELAGERVLRLLRRGMPPGEVAVVFRDPDRYASLLDQVFGAYGIPYSIDRSVRLSHTGLGRGLLALVRCAVLGGGADDLLAWLRTPGKLDNQALADQLEAEVRREGTERAEGARAIWEAKRWPLDELDRLRDAGSPDAFLAELDRQLARLFAAPWHRRAALLSGAELDHPRAYNAAHDALQELRALSPTTLDHRRVHDLLAELPVRLGEDPQPDRLQVASPEAVRARRFQAVLLCGLQEGEFPRGASPEPFLPDADRREIASASGLVLSFREDQLDRERYLFYVCASRAERLLVLSSRYCDEEGDPEAESFFLEDVREQLDGLEPRTRSLSDVSWSPEEAPTAAEYERAVALLGPRTEPAEPQPLSAESVMAELETREAVSAGALEHFADCPVKWLVEDLLRPNALEPDPEQMVRGSYAHSVLRRTYERLREETGERRITPANLPLAERLALEALRAGRSEFKLSPKQTRVRAAVRRLEFDVLRYLRHEAARDGSFEPEHLELEFGPVAIDGVKVRGRIDRVDVHDGRALVRDYKSGKSVDSYKAASWEDKNRFQAALYMLAVEQVLRLEPAGGVYDPLGGDDRRARGLLASELASALGSDFVRGDMLPADAFEARLVWARERIADMAERMRHGRLCAKPDSCAWNGGCAYPSICRTES
jgi:ATP-dependent helicase/DNAse subunit B